jgi:putative ABC transport system permease protein
MTAWTLAWRTASSERARTILAIAGVTVIGALLFDMLMLSRGLLVSFREMLDTAGYDVRVTASDNLAVRTSIADASALAAALARLPEVSEVAVFRRDRAALVGSGRARGAVTLMNVSGNAERRAWTIVSGTGLGDDAHEPPAIVIDRKLAADRELTVGSNLRLRVLIPGTRSALPAVDFRVSGIADFEFDSPDEPVVATTRAGFERARASGPSDDADMLLVRSAATSTPGEAVGAIRRLRSDVRAFSNEQLVSQVNENGFAYFRQISFVLSSITLGFAFLLLATLLTVSVNQRLGQVAALRALGIPRRRIASALLWESALMVATGAALSVPIGWVLASQLDRILREMPGIPRAVHFFVFEPRIAMFHLGLLAATGAIAAAYPVWIATRLPIAATLRLETS